MRYPGIVLLAVFWATCPVVAEADLQALIDECESCHGPGGRSVEADVPALAGRDADELFEALEAFYYYERHCSTTTYRHGDRPKTPLNMCNVSSSMSDTDRRAIAEHFAGVAGPE